MDQNDIFYKLNAGTKYSKKYSKINGKIFDDSKPKKEEKTKVDYSKLDFFNTNVVSQLGKRPNSEVVNESDDEDTKDLENNEDNDNNNNEDEENSEEEENSVTETLTTKKINQIRKKHKILVESTDSIDPILTFEQLKEKYQVRDYLVENLNKIGIQTPTPIQMQSIPILLEGNELLACAPTGSGKTASFTIPLLHKLKGPEKGGFRALVISPTRELAVQTSQHIEQLSEGKNFRVCLLSKSTAPTVGSNRRFDILVSTPLRLVRLIEEGSIQLDKVEYLVLDEADQLFDLGFIKQVDEIIAMCSNPKIQRCLFSATIPPGVEQMAKSFLRNPSRVVIGAKNAATETIKQRLIYCGQEEGKILAIRQLIDQGIKPPVIIFVQSKDRAMELFHELVYDGINVDVITADRTKAQRDATVKNFRLGKIWILIASDLMARGMDFKGVNLVINFDIPPSPVQYIHRIGRAGRAGRSGESITLYTLDDVEVLRGIVNVMKASGMKVPEWMNSLPKNSSKKKKKKILVIERDSLRTDQKTLKENYIKNRKKMKLQKKQHQT